jgi:hypothetical protein
MRTQLTALAGVVVVAGCFSEPLETPRRDSIEPPEPLSDAFYMLQPEDLLGQNHQGLPPADLTAYGLFVCNAGMDPDEVRARRPGAVVLGYANSHQVPLWGNSEPWTSYRALFAEEDYWHDASGNRVSTRANTEELRYTAENAADLASFLAARWAGWDGIYLDDVYGVLPANPVLNQLPVTSAEWATVRAEWVAYRDALVTQLGAAYPGLIVGNVGNVGSAVAHLPLDGHCAEEWWPTELPAILAQFQRLDPSLCIAWEWDAGDAARRGDVRYR